MGWEGQRAGGMEEWVGLNVRLLVKLLEISPALH